MNITEGMHIPSSHFVQLKWQHFTHLKLQDGEIYLLPTTAKVSEVVIHV